MAAATREAEVGGALRPPQLQGSPSNANSAGTDSSSDSGASGGSSSSGSDSVGEPVADDGCNGVGNRSAVASCNNGQGALAHSAKKAYSRQRSGRSERLLKSDRPLKLKPSRSDHKQRKRYAGITEL